MSTRLESASPATASPATARALRQLRRHGGLVALLVLVLVNIAITPNFLQLQTLFVNISQVATIAIVAIGMTLVIATGGIDLSVGAVMAL
ncbi:MAG: ABC transporter permease, partial [Geminicoccaceae bacterium]|nr:ABC transporter permease [Geminicoccaceae bacterium]